MIYNIYSDYDNSALSSYPAVSVEAGVPLDEYKDILKGRVKKEETRLADIEKAYNSYNEMSDELLGIPVHNVDQMARLKQLREKHGIDDSLFNVDDIDSFSKKGNLSTMKRKVDNFFKDPDYKNILMEQKNSEKFLQGIAEISLENEPLALIAKKDFMANYLDKADRSYAGFSLDINNYKPIDLEQEVSKIAKQIEREYDLVVDPDSPEGDGYLFINKISKATEKGKDVFKRRLNQMSTSSLFKNNLKSYVAINSPTGDMEDKEAYDFFVSEMMNTYLSDKNEDSFVRPVKTASGSSSSSSTSTTSVKKTSTGSSGRSTETERKVNRLIDELSEKFEGYDYESLFSRFDSGMRVDGETAPFVHKDGRLVIPVVKGNESFNIYLDKEKSNIPSPEQLKSLTANMAVKTGAYSDNGAWVYKGPSGRVVYIEEPVKLKDQGLPLKGDDDFTENFHLSKKMAERAVALDGVLKGIEIDYVITEAGTDTLTNGHKNRLHYTGDTYDMSIGRSPKAEDVYKVLASSRVNGVKAVFETKDKSLLQKVNQYVEKHNKNNVEDLRIEKAETYDHITGSHFSMYNDYRRNYVTPDGNPVQTNTDPMGIFNIKK